MRFWDSSALVPLVLQQSGSAEAERWLGEDPEAVTWTLTRVDVVPALRRLARDGELPENAAARGETLAAAREGFRVVPEG